MSLKAFHIVFITASILLSFGFGAWLINRYTEVGGWIHLAGGILAGVAGLCLLVYGKYFLRKFKHLGYI